MRRIVGELRILFPIAAALILGYAARAFHTAPREVLAQSRSASQHSQTDDTLGFQLSGIGPTSALTVYNPSERTLYVYPAVTQGSTHVNCSFMLHVDRPGGEINRQNCAPGSTP